MTYELKGFIGIGFWAYYIHLVFLCNFVRCRCPFRLSIDSLLPEMAYVLLPVAAVYRVGHSAGGTDLFQNLKSPKNQ